MTTYLVPAQAGAQFISLFVYAMIAKWYIAPWLKARGRADALIALLWVHVFRYVALQAVSAQRDGFPISDTGVMEIVVGDLGGAILAFATIVLLRYRAGIAIPLTWLLVLETIYDSVSNIRGGVREHLMGAAGGVTWLVLVFFVPMIIVSLALLVWQLYARRSEALNPLVSVQRRVSETEALAASSF
jgi:hypothetical protein